MDHSKVSRGEKLVDALVDRAIAHNTSSNHMAGSPWWTASKMASDREALNLARTVAVALINQRDELLAALKALERQALQSSVAYRPNQLGREALESARAAIANAGSVP